MQPNIMFVDDSLYILECLKWVFKDEPYWIYTFDDPFEALRALESEAYAVVVADQNMPGMDGIELLQQVRQRWPSTAGIIMTAYAETEPARQAVCNGHALCIISKPWGECDLKYAVKKAVLYYQAKVQLASHNPVVSAP